jgi:hypothetical protein
LRQYRPGKLKKMMRLNAAVFLDPPHLAGSSVSFESEAPLSVEKRGSGSKMPPRHAGFRHLIR